MVCPLLFAASRAFRSVLQRMRWHAPQRGWGGGGRGGRSPAPLAGLTRIVRPSSSVEKCERKRSSTWPIRTRTRCSGERNLRRTYSRRLSLENQRPRKWTTFSGQSALTPRRPVRRSSSTRVSSRPSWRDAPMEFCEKRSWLTRSQPRFLGCPPAHSDAVVGTVGSAGQAIGQQWGLSLGQRAWASGAPASASRPQTRDSSHNRLFATRSFTRPSRSSGIRASSGPPLVNCSTPPNLACRRTATRGLGDGCTPQLLPPPPKRCTATRWSGPPAAPPPTHRRTATQWWVGRRLRRRASLSSPPARPGRGGIRKPSP